ncbi:MAG: 50S ribosomal protein L6, partial [Elusimicrobia bacterium RIFCSPLOWO2_01_FULL_54_10]
MSRVGKKPIALPAKVTVTLKDSVLEVKGPHGTLSRIIPQAVSVDIGKEQIVISQKGKDNPQAPMLHGLIRTLIANMIQGVVEPWKREPEIQGVGFRAAKQGQVLNLSLGFSHPVNYDMPASVQFSVDAKQTLISMTCPDRELLGVVSAKIRAIRPPEPYKGKGVRYLGEHVARKAGKAAGAA